MTKTLKTTAAVSAFAALAFAHGMVQAYAGSDQVRRVAPLKGISFDVGAKHAVSYFIAENGRCAVTLVVADRPVTENDVPAAGSRVSVAVDGGKSVRFDTAQGKSLEFACEKAAASMTVRTVDQVAWAPAAK